MRIDPSRLVLSALLLATAASAPAQSLPGGLGGLLGGALPSVAQTGAGNAAGVLGYCVKNKLVSQTGAQSILGKLTGQKAVTDSPEYSAGQSGILQTGGGMLPIAGLKGKVKTKLCDMVLSHAKSFL